MNGGNKRWIINTILFVMCFLFLFVRVSYLFRPGSVNRRNIIGYYCEQKNSLDVVLIGGSSTYVFWAPYVAWNQRGIVSYNFATDSVSPALLINMIKEASKTQTPSLYVIDLRALEVRETHPGFYSEWYLRNITDSLKYSQNRAEMIRYAFGYEQGDKEDLTANHIDLMLYHSNWQNLNKNNFLYSSNDQPEKLKGFWMVNFAFHSPLREYDWTHVQERRALSESTDRILTELLEYCRQEELPVLFTLNPICATDSGTKEIYNYVGDVVAEYGYEFLNTNDYYREMGIDFSHDFYNRDHVNLYGAEKYTAFLAKYISENYSIPDRRGEPDYEEWNAGYEVWCQEAEKEKALIDDVIANE